MVPIFSSKTFQFAIIVIAYCYLPAQHYLTLLLGQDLADETFTWELFPKIKT